MKKLLFSVFVLLVLSTACSKAPDFRNSYWGETPSDVKTTELAVLDLETTVSLNYRDVIGDYGVYIRYFFNDRKLYGGTINYFLKSNNVEDVGKDLECIKQMYISKYGKPDEEAIFDVKNYKSFPELVSQFGNTKNGYMSTFAKWDFKRKGYSIGIYLRTDTSTSEAFVDVLYVYTKDMEDKFNRSLDNPSNNI